MSWRGVTVGTGDTSPVMDKLDEIMNEDHMHLAPMRRSLELPDQGHG